MVICHYNKRLEKAGLLCVYLFHCLYYSIFRLAVDLFFIVLQNRIIGMGAGKIFSK